MSAERRADPFCSMRLLSLICLFVQNAGLVVLMRYSRTRTDRPMFLATTAVTVDEFTKLSLSIFMVTWHWYWCREDKKQDLRLCWRKVFEPRICLLMAVPALVYTVQKNLLYIALTNLDACVYQAVYTGKHITTAVFSYFILGRQMSRMQQVALVILMGGVALVQASQLTQARGPKGDQPLLGFMAVALACCSSGFASVYLEYFIKNADYWAKQVQLALPALLCAILGVLWSDGRAVASGGFFQGYDGIVLLTIFFEVAGGLLVACVTKYADSIVKNIAIALSLTAITAASALIWHFPLSHMFLAGAIVTVAAAYVYTYNPPKAPAQERSFADAKQVEDGGLRALSPKAKLTGAENC